MLISLTFKELKNRFAFLFVLTGAIGLTGWITLDIFKNSIDQAIKSRSKIMLGADLMISSRKPISDQARNIVKQLAGLGLEESQITQTFSMVSNPQGKSRLVLIKAVQKNYPLYGFLKENQTLQEKSAWVYPEILDQLDFKLGDQISIGETSFRISNIIEEDPSPSTTDNLAPRIYISHKHLKDTQLIKSEQSLAFYSYIYKTPHIKDLSALKQNIFKQINDPAVTVNTHTSHSETLTRLMSYLNDFLSLCSLCALILTCIGIGFLFRSYFKKKTLEMAILISLGLSRTYTFSIYLLQMTVLGLISFLTALVFSMVLLPFLKTAVQDLLPFEVSIQWHTFTASLLAVLVPIAVTLPILAGIRKIKPSLLLHQRTGFSFDPLNLVFYVLGIFILWGLAVLQSHSFRIGSLFTLIFVSSAVLLTGFGWLLLKLSSYVQSSSFVWRMAFRDLSRRPLSSLSCFVSLGLGVLLLNLIPQMEKAVSSEIQGPSHTRPSIFLFDIQEEQKQWVLNHVKIDKIIPMIRSRLTAVNGENFNKGSGQTEWSREKTREMHFRNRSFNLSYQNQLSRSEKIIKGKIWPSYRTARLPAVSLERRFAKRLGLKMGDRLTFDVQGQKVEGLVQSLREVQWLSFQPNFFILFQPGVLEEFSKTYLASLPPLSPAEKQQTQKSLAQKFPNISALDISRITKKFLNLAQNILLALKIMTFLCLTASLAVLYSIISHQMHSRIRDVGLLKILGVSFTDIKKLFLYQFGLMALAAHFTGLAASLAASSFASALLFQADWKFSIVPFTATGLSWILSCAIIILSTNTALKTPVQKLLQN